MNPIRPSPMRAAAPWCAAVFLKGDGVKAALAKHPSKGDVEQGGRRWRMGERCVPAETDGQNRALDIVAYIYDTHKQYYISRTRILLSA